MTQAKSQDSIRKRRARKGQCLQCGEPAAVSETTGKPRKLCRNHLDADAKRSAARMNGGPR